MRVLVVSVAYMALGTGVFAGCGEPGMQSQDRAMGPAPGAPRSSEAQPAQAPAAATGLRHSTGDASHVVGPRSQRAQEAGFNPAGSALALDRPAARAATSSTGDRALESVAACDETEYADGDKEDSSQLPAKGSDRSPICQESE